MEKNRIKVKDLTICSEVYFANPDEIETVFVTGLSLFQDEPANEKDISVNVGNYSFNRFDAKESDEVLKNECKRLFLNYVDALAEQKRLRKEKLEDAEKKMDEAISRYQKLLKKYTDVIDKSVEL